MAMSSRSPNEVRFLLLHFVALARLLQLQLPLPLPLPLPLSHFISGSPARYFMVGSLFHGRLAISCSEHEMEMANHEMEMANHEIENFMKQHRGAEHARSSVNKLDVGKILRERRAGTA